MVSRQWVGWPRSQAAQRPQLPRVVSTTWSPTATLATASPTWVDDARALVAEDDRGRERDGAVEHRHVAVAQPGVRRCAPGPRGGAGRAPRRRRGPPAARSHPTMPFTARLLLLARPHDRLELAVGVEGEAAPVPPDAGELEAAERRLGALLGGVEGHAARPELAGHPQARAVSPVNT